MKERVVVPSRPLCLSIMKICPDHVAEVVRGHASQFQSNFGSGRGFRQRGKAGQQGEQDQGKKRFFSWWFPPRDIPGRDLLLSRPQEEDRTLRMV